MILCIITYTYIIYIKFILQVTFNILTASTSIIGALEISTFAWDGAEFTREQWRHST